MKTIQMGMVELAESLGTGALTSVAIVEAFLERIQTLQSDLRPMARVFPQMAMQAALESDTRRKNNQALSRFDGVPITLKESIDMKGEATTLGLESRKEHRANRNAVVTDLVNRAGMIVLGKSNVSQALLFNESRNPLFGQSVNPFDSKRGPGGSSGGEAAAIAAYASPGGFGTDIGGSIRVPAHYCGICGLKPTVDRISNRGVVTAIPGQEVARGQVGPMARTVADLRGLLDVTSPTQCSALDPRVSPQGWQVDAPVPLKELRVGYYTYDGIIEASAANQRAVDKAATVFRDAGATVTPFEPPMAEEILYTYLGALSADGGKTLSLQLPKEDADMALSLLFSMVRMPNAARKAAGVGMAALGERVAGRMLEAFGEKSTHDLWRLTARARQLRLEVFDHWVHHGFDIVLCPPHATPALPHGASKTFMIGGTYAFRYNLLNFPAGVVPVTMVRSDETGRLNRRQKHDREAAHVDMYSDGLPVGVQVVSRPGREDLILDAMQVIEETLSAEDDYPRLPFV